MLRSNAPCLCCTRARGSARFRSASRQATPSPGRRSACWRISLRNLARPLTVCDWTSSCRRVSRQRIVAAQDAERRRLERDLHDGAQQYLVALGINARLARELVRSEPAEAESLLDDVSSQATEALASLRDLARGR